MTPTSLNEASLELLIMSDLTRVPVADIKGAGSQVRELPVPYDADWIIGSAEDYDRALGLDVPQLIAFLKATQPEVVEGLRLDQEGPLRDSFLQRLSNRIMQDGVIRTLRKGVQHQQFTVQMYYPLPTPGNTTAGANFRRNRYIVTRQLRYSTEQTQRALDLAIFINGLPVFTFELKNTITSQTVSQAMEQYKTTRPTSERLFRFGICTAHFAMDDQEVHFTTKLANRSTTFLPLNRGFDDGAGNPPNPDGIKTDYLWKQIFQRESLANILESFVQQVEEKDEKTGKKKHTIIFPRYHQLDVVRKLLAHADEHGHGHRYLIQHSAGSGKSNSVAWLAQQLVELQHQSSATFDSVIVVTDRRVFDSQINNTIRSMSNSTWMIGHADRSGDLRTLISEGKRIIITTVQKFPFIVDDMGDSHRDRSFAIIIDEAHSSQGGRASGQMNAALGGTESEEDEAATPEDRINAIMENRKMLSNASYFAFTATPKQRTLELFGTRQQDGTFAPFHTYSMKQAIEEGFILDVLKQYTPINSYYRLVKTIADDPEFDVRKAGRELRNYVDSNPDTIARKAKVIVDHFQSQVINAGKINGQARGMVATQSIRRAINYWKAINHELAGRGNPWKTIVAFTGEHDVDGVMQTEYTLNGFPSSQIPQKLKEQPYRMLIVADKFLTGFDEPLLHTMYVDKTLSGVKAVQALSRLNRSHPGKKDTFVLDFANDPEMIADSFQPYYRTTVLAKETDPNKLHDLKAKLDAAGVYQDALVIDFVDRYLADVSREQLDAMLDICVTHYKELDEEGQIEFKGSAKAFVRTYNFLSQLLPWTNADWERLSIFLTFLTPRLPAPKDDEVLDRSILDAIDLDSYRAEQKAMMNLALEDEGSILEQAESLTGGGKPDPEYDLLSSIVQSFNEIFADANFTDSDRIAQHMSGPTMDALVGDEQLRRIAASTDDQNQRIAFDTALDKMVNANWNDHYELIRKLGDDP